MGEARPTMPIPVHLARCAGYDHPDLPGTVAGLLGRVLPQDLAGVRVLVKPNLVGPRTMALATTHPAVVRAVCLALLARGAEVRVGDSPAFGTARSMARLTGLTRALAGLPVRIVNLGRPRPLRLSFGATIGLSADALDAGLIVNLPKLKAHSQMRVTGAVKNLFGCVVGFRKAFAHARHGDHGCRFASLILEVAQALPPTVSLVDGVTAILTRSACSGPAPCPRPWTPRSGRCSTSLRRPCPSGARPRPAGCPAPILRSWPIPDSARPTSRQRASSSRRGSRPRPSTPTASSAAG
jgi:uncharacterized protein (DUF362 family)